MIGSTELILIIVVCLLLFGGKKIPELMRGLGKGVRSFKDGMNEITAEQEQDTSHKFTESVSPDEPKEDSSSSDK